MMNAKPNSLYHIPVFGEISLFTVGRSIVLADQGGRETVRFAMHPTMVERFRAIFPEHAFVGDELISELGKQEIAVDPELSDQHVYFCDDEGYTTAVIDLSRPIAENTFYSPIFKEYVIKINGAQPSKH